MYGFPIGNWCVSRIQDFSFLFNTFDSGSGDRFNPGAAFFNEDISRWDVSSATTTRSMFDAAASFDQPLGNWNVSSVTDMANMFIGASSFNQSLGDWDVSSVKDMQAMFLVQLCLTSLLAIGTCRV
jgi:surface protein